jgi:uncharacterized protein (DUF2236 family)
MLTRTAARKINRERVVLLGWGRAVLLQFAHPLVAAAVAEHSPFREDGAGYVRRVHRTVGAMLSLTFAPEAEAAAVIARINGIHDRTHGTLRERAGRYPAGTRYSARDPDLLLWVHATLIESNLLAYERFVGPLTTEERDAYCREASPIAVMLGVPESRVPASAAELTEHLRNTLAGGDIEVTPAARTLAAALLAPPLGPVSPFFRLVRLVTVGLLPPDVRTQYGFEWNGARAARLDRFAAWTRRNRPFLPRALREWPAARRESALGS